MQEGMCGQDDTKHNGYLRARLSHRSGPVPDAVPITLDEGVETIGEAFLEGEGNVATKEKIGMLFFFRGEVWGGSRPVA